MDCFICIHGHYYQPPPKNPWLEEIETQDSTYPCHNWNERITAECHEPNAAARTLDDRGRIIRSPTTDPGVQIDTGRSQKQESSIPIAFLVTTKREPHDPPEGCPRHQETLDFLA